LSGLWYQRFQSIILGFIDSGLVRRQKVTVEGVCGGGVDLTEKRKQRRGMQEGARAGSCPIGHSPVTYFLQLGPCSFPFATSK
jgi:hypothetical protein